MLWRVLLCVWLGMMPGAADACGSRAWWWRLRRCTSMKEAVLLAPPLPSPPPPLGSCPLPQL